MRLRLACRYDVAVDVWLWVDAWVGRDSGFLGERGGVRD